jgi:hypothetical protein
MPRERRLLVALVALVIGGFANASAARANVCDDIPSVPMVPNPVKTGCEIVSKAPEVVADPGKAATDIVTAPVKAAGDAVMQGVTEWVANGAGWLVSQAGHLIGETTTPRIESPWFLQQYATMGGLAAVFALPLLLLAILQGVLRRDGGVIVRAAFVQLPAAFVLTAMAIAVVAVLLALTDEMSARVAGSVGSDANAFFTDAAKALGALSAATGNGAVPLFAVFLGGLIAAVGAFFVWIELLIRSAAIYVAVLFLPFTFVAMIWPHTARWCRRLLELLFAIVFAKFVIVAIMALAAAGMGQSRSDDAFQGVLAGGALMLLAAFSPFVLLRLIPLAEAAAHNASSRSGVGSQTLGPIAGPSAVMRRVVDSNWGAMAGGGLRAAPAAATSGPVRMTTAQASGTGGGVPTGAEEVRHGGHGHDTSSARDRSASSTHATQAAPTPREGRPADAGSRPDSGRRPQDSPQTARPGREQPTEPAARPRRRDQPPGGGGASGG